MANLFNIIKMMKSTSICVLLCYPLTVFGECTCDVEAMGQVNNKGQALKFKLAAIASILVSGAIGVSLPLLSKKIPALRPENDVFFMVKAFAAGVILSTGFIHILPKAFESLSSPCLGENPWGNFPIAGFIAMLSAIGTLMIDSFATGYYLRQNSRNKSRHIVDEEMMAVDHSDHVHMYSQPTHGHAHHGSADSSSSQELALSELLRKRVVSQVLELGILVHSVIIGISLGASQDPKTIKPLIAALSFHQFFEGMGLGGCISQAQFKSRAMAVMATFFSLTAPMGTAIGIGLSSVYKENSPTALIVQGIFDSASSGILIYMALVDLLAADFMNPKLQTNLRLLLGANASLLIGSGCMSVLAKWS